MNAARATRRPRGRAGSRPAGRATGRNRTRPANGCALVALFGVGTLLGALGYAAVWVVSWL